MAGLEQGDNIDAAAATRPRTGTPGGRVKVKDLIAQLSKLDQNLEVYCFEEEDSAPIENGNPGPYDICSISAEFVSRTRHSGTRKPILKFEGNIPGAQLTVIIGITPEF